jgi:hypothetical protein
MLRVRLGRSGKSALSRIHSICRHSNTRWCCGLPLVLFPVSAVVGLARGRTLGLAQAASWTVTGAEGFVFFIAEHRNIWPVA